MKPLGGADTNVAGTDHAYGVAMNRRDRLSIHLVSYHYFVGRVKGNIDGNRNFVVFALEVSIVCNSNQL